MKTLDFKTWLEDMSQNDPATMAAQQAALAAGQQAIQQKKDPVAAIQQSVLKSKLPLNKIGKIMPKADDSQQANQPNTAIK